MHHGGSSRLNDGRASVQCALCMVGTRVSAVLPHSESSSYRAVSMLIMMIITRLYFLSSVLRSPFILIHHSAIPPFNSPMVQ